jgi:peroxiredoxin (alkyl hydroperoxide reductase subunit C)
MEGGIVMRVLVGQTAPNFNAPVAASGENMNVPVRTVTLADYRGRWLVFLWYPADFTFVCPTELLALSDRLDEFADMDAAVLGASTDSVYSHRAWLNTPRSQNGIEGLRFPLLADKSGKVARDFGILLEDEGVALRGLFMIDPQGIVQYALAHNLSTGRSVDETLRVLAALQTGELCGSDWEPGQETL